MRPASWFRLFICGLCVGAADIVPGISGGTVAFIIGIYEELLSSIASLNAKAFKLLFKLQIGAFFQSIAWRFLLAFLLGVACSFLTLAKGFQYLLNDEALRPLLYAGFMGLVVGSVIFCARLLPKVDRKSCIRLALGAVAAYLLSGADLAPKSNEPCYSVAFHSHIANEKPLANVDGTHNRLLHVPLSQLSAMVAKKYLNKNEMVIDEATNAQVCVADLLQTGSRSYVDVWVVACGAIAISAMLLPGISGSYLLNILGMYGFVIGALVDWVDGVKLGYFDLSAFRIVASMGVGICFGALTFARVVKYLLARYREATIATLVGFMVGAIGSVWPFWSYSYELSALHLDRGPLLCAENPILPDFASSTFALSCFFFAAGVLAVFLVEYLSKRRVESASSLVA